MEYHWTDAFSNADGNGRISYYNISASPTAKFDGKRTVVGGYSGTFSQYLSNYNWEMQFYLSACSLNIFVDYDSTTRKLWVKARVTKVDTFSNTHLRYAIAESHIYYPWQGLDSLHHVLRKMLPNYNGIVIPDTLEIGESFVDSQTYTLSPAWEDANCYVVVFVQRDDSTYYRTPVFRSAKSGLFETWVFGDATGDGIVDVADIVYLLNYLFAGGPAPNPLASGDANYDCTVDIGDAVYLVNYVFVEGPEPEKGCAW